jgi:hypothetical protein
MNKQLFKIIKEHPDLLHGKFVIGEFSTYLVQ